MNVLIASGCFFLSFLTISGLNWLDLIPWRKTRGEHWAERARVLWPVRKKSAILVIYVPLLVAEGSSLLWACPGTVLVLRGLCGFAGALGGCWFLNRELFPGLRLRPWLHDVVVGTVLRLGLWLVFIAIAYSMPDRFGSRVWLMLAGALVLQVIWPLMALGLLRLLGIIHPAGDRLRQIVAQCTPAGGPRVRGLWQARGVTANALALPLSGTLVFMDKLLEILTEEEVAAVCAHEIGHLTESWLTLLGRHLGAMAILPLLLLQPAVHQWGAGGFLIMVLATVGGLRLARKLAQRMETRADQIARHAEAGDGVYARALEKIYQTNQVPAVMPGKNMTHPHLYDRMTAAGVIPGFPRPLPPERFNLTGWLLLIASPLLLVWMIVNR